MEFDQLPRDCEWVSTLLACHLPPSLTKFVLAYVGTTWYVFYQFYAHYDLRGSMKPRLLTHGIGQNVQLHPGPNNSILLLGPFNASIVQPLFLHPRWVVPAPTKLRWIASRLWPNFYGLAESPLALWCFNSLRQTWTEVLPRGRLAQLRSEGVSMLTEHYLLIFTTTNTALVDVRSLEVWWRARPCKTWSTSSRYVSLDDSLFELQIEPLGLRFLCTAPTHISSFVVCGDAIVLKCAGQAIAFVNDRLHPLYRDVRWIGQSACSTLLVLLTNGRLLDHDLNTRAERPLCTGAVGPCSMKQSPQWDLCLALLGQLLSLAPKPWPDDALLAQAGFRFHLVRGRTTGLFAWPAPLPRILMAKVRINSTRNLQPKERCCVLCSCVTRSPLPTRILI
jgi:hypothetical protein